VLQTHPCGDWAQFWAQPAALAQEQFRKTSQNLVPSVRVQHSCIVLIFEKSRSIRPNRWGLQAQDYR